MTKLTKEKYKEMLSSHAQDILSLRSQGEEVRLLEYAASSEYTFKPRKALELLAVSENAFESNKGLDFINSAHYDSGVLAENIIMTMALNALMDDLTEAIYKYNPD